MTDTASWEVMCSLCGPSASMGFKVFDPNVMFVTAGRPGYTHVGGGEEEGDRDEEREEEEEGEGEEEEREREGEEKGEIEERKRRELGDVSIRLHFFHATCFSN